MPRPYLLPAILGPRGSLFCSTSSEYTVPLGIGLKVAITHAAFRISAHTVYANEGFTWMQRQLLFSLSYTVRKALVAACQSCLVFLHSSHAVIDIPPQPLL